MASEAPPSASLMKWVVPIGLFVAIVGAIAWVTQNLPRGTPKSPVIEGVVHKERAADLRFTYKFAVWDDLDPSYAKEYEMGKEGHFDFPVHNPNSFPVTLGFARASCDCSHLLATVLDSSTAEKIKGVVKPTADLLPGAELQWTKLTKDDKTGLEIPPGGWAIARLEWHGRKQPGEQLRINIQVWMHPASSPDDRSFESLGVPVLMSAPIRFYPERIALGTIAAGGSEQGEMLAWSPTRDDFELKVDPSKFDPLLDVSVEKLTPAAAKALREKFQKTALDRLDDPKAIENLQKVHESENRQTRIRSAYRIHATLREQKAGKQLDQGHFNRELPLLAPDLGHPLPPVTAMVRGDIDIGLPDDNGKVNLRTFPAMKGVHRAFPLSTESDAELVIDHVVPKALEVKLTRNTKDSSATRHRWTLDVTVPPAGWFGPFQESALIMLRTNTTPPRRVRIPVVGVGGQG